MANLAIFNTNLAASSRWGCSAALDGIRNTHPGSDLCTLPFSSWLVEQRMILLGLAHSVPGSCQYSLRSISISTVQVACWDNEATMVQYLHG